MEPGTPISYPSSQPYLDLSSCVHMDLPAKQLMLVRVDQKNKYFYFEVVSGTQSSRIQLFSTAIHLVGLYM